MKGPKPVCRLATKKLSQSRPARLRGETRSLRAVLRERSTETIEGAIRPVLTIAGRVYRRSERAEIGDRLGAARRAQHDDGVVVLVLRRRLHLILGQVERH